jgi:hypothetical protein
MAFSFAASPEIAAFGVNGISLILINLRPSDSFMLV